MLSVTPRRLASFKDCQAATGLPEQTVQFLARVEAVGAGSINVSDLRPPHEQVQLLTAMLGSRRGEDLSPFVFDEGTVIQVEASWRGKSLRAYFLKIPPALPEIEYLDLQDEWLDANLRLSRMTD